MRAMNGKETAQKWQKGSSPTPSSHPMPAGTSAPTTTTTAAADIVTDDVEGSSLSPPPRPARSRRRRPTRPSTAPERDASTAFLPSFPSGHGLAAEECQERCTAEEQPSAPRAFGHMQTVREDEDHGACASIARSQRAHTSFQRGALVYPPPRLKNPACMQTPRTIRMICQSTTGRLLWTFTPPVVGTPSVYRASRSRTPRRPSKPITRTLSLNRRNLSPTGLLCATTVMAPRPGRRCPHQSPPNLFAPLRQPWVQS